MNLTINFPSLVSVLHSKNKFQSPEKVTLFNCDCEAHFSRARSKWLNVCGLFPWAGNHRFSDLFVAYYVATFCPLLGLMPASQCPFTPSPIASSTLAFLYIFPTSSVLLQPPDSLLNILTQFFLTQQQAGACTCSDCPRAWRGNEGSRKAACLPVLRFIIPAKVQGSPNQDTDWAWQIIQQLDHQRGGSNGIGLCSLESTFYQPLSLSHHKALSASSSWGLPIIQSVGGYELGAKSILI